MVTLLFVLGLVALVFGADTLVRGASQLAITAGVTPLVVGLTVVAFGTSAPEMAVSVRAAVAGEAGIAVGNVVGSNIFNVLFILGAAALIAPLAVSNQLIRIEVPLMIAVSVISFGLCWNGTIGFVEGIFLFVVLLLYTGAQVWSGRRQKAAEKRAAEEKGESEEYEEAKGAAGVLLAVVRVLGGLVLLVIGARWLVDSAVAYAEWFGVSEVVIGLTIVAAGTSLPELVTSLVASIRGERDIAVGNVVGSNVFNLLAVLGLSATFSPQAVVVDPAMLRFDFPVMLGVAVCCLPIFITGKRVSRLEGGMMLLAGVVYTTSLIMMQKA